MADSTQATRFGSGSGWVTPEREGPTSFGRVQVIGFEWNPQQFFRAAEVGATEFDRFGPQTPPQK